MPACPECGGQTVPGMSCDAKFHECLAMEFTDPGYGSVHHLTVATYMLQHSSKLSRQGWVEMRQVLKTFLVEKKDPADVRRKNKANVDSGKRSWKITSGDGVPWLGKFRWTKTIVNVNTEEAVGYSSDVMQWALAALADAEKVEI
jgi:hypothetical protein